MINEHDEVVEAVGTTGSPADETGEAQAEETLTMDELMARYEAAEPMQELRAGEVVMGTVVQIDEQCAMVDVGTKSEGMIPKQELDEIRDQIKVGDKIQVYVSRIEDEDGNLIVSKLSADRERAWEDIVDMERSGEILDAPVIEAVKGGLLVDLGLYGQGFVPASHVSVRRPRNLNKYVGQVLRLQVIEVERKRKRVVLSHRKVVEDQRAAEREDTLSTLREGQVRRGLVRRLTDFGAFVDIGGVDGLLHISEMSWTRVDSPGEMLRVGDEAEVMVLKLNLEEGRISLGMRQLQSDPWREIPRLYREGQVIRARVLEEIDEGVVVRLAVGLDLLVPLPEEMRRSAATPVAEAAAPAVDESAPAEPVTEAAAEAAPAEPVEAVEPAAAGEAPADSLYGFASGQEIDVHVDRLIPVEREIAVSLAASRTSESRSEPAGEPERARSAGSRPPLARGRYSDRRGEEGDDERGGDNRPSPAGGRRERRRERDRDDEREVAATEATTAPTRRTLGDLMGDKLRSLFQEEDAADEGKE